MAIDVGDVAAKIVTAMQGVFKTNWPVISSYATGEAQKLAHTFVQIAELRASNQISEAEGSVLLEMQKNATRGVLLAVQGMGLLTVEEAINAALAAVKDIVNTAIGFVLI